MLLNADIFAYWDDVEAEFRQQGFSPKGFSVKEFIKWEFFRHSQGLDNYEHAHDIFVHYDQALLAQVFEHPDRIPRAISRQLLLQVAHPRPFSCVLFKTGSNACIMELLSREIVMANGLFERSAAGNFGLDKSSSPGSRCHSNGSQQGVLGKGFMAIVFCAWCRNRWLPVDVRYYREVQMKTLILAYHCGLLGNDSL